MAGTGDFKKNNCLYLKVHLFTQKLKYVDFLLLAYAFSIFCRGLVYIFHNVMSVKQFRRIFCTKSKLLMVKFVAN